MKLDLFSFEELQEMQTIELWGGASSLSQAQFRCSNTAIGCAYGADQYECSNKVTGCNYTPATTQPDKGGDITMKPQQWKTSMLFQWVKQMLNFSIASYWNRVIGLQ